jgi:transposase-like protein
MIGPELAVADGALGFWKALEEVWPKARGQRCWVHKTANLLNKLPKSKGKGQARIGADLDGRDQEGCFRRICRVR